jgi:hypothetical protein
VIRWFCVLVVGGVVSAFAFLLLNGQYSHDGPVVITVAPRHGLHEGDLFVIGGWAVSMLALLALAVISGRRNAS